jgi:hypothetical protein
VQEKIYLLGAATRILFNRTDYCRSRSSKMLADYSHSTAFLEDM